MTTTERIRERIDELTLLRSKLRREKRAVEALSAKQKRESPAQDEIMARAEGVADAISILNHRLTRLRGWRCE